MFTFENIFLSGFLHMHEINIDFRGRQVWQNVTEAHLALLRSRSDAVAVAGEKWITDISNKQPSPLPKTQTFWPYARDKCVPSPLDLHHQT